MIASDPIRTLRLPLQAGGRPHMDSALALEPALGRREAPTRVAPE
jgi:hypothetical protein